LTTVFTNAAADADTEVAILERVSVNTLVVLASILTTVLAEESTTFGAVDTVGGAKSVMTAGVIAGDTVVGVVSGVLSRLLALPDAVVATLIVLSVLVIVMVVMESFTMVVIESGVVDGVGGAVVITIMVTELGAVSVGLATAVANRVALNGVITVGIVVSGALAAADLSVDIVTSLTKVEELVLVAVLTGFAESEFVIFETEFILVVALSVILLFIIIGDNFVFVLLGVVGVVNFDVFAVVVTELVAVAVAASTGDIGGGDAVGVALGGSTVAALSGSAVAGGAVGALSGSSVALGGTVAAAVRVLATTVAVSGGNSSEECKSEFHVDKMWYRFYLIYSCLPAII